MAKKKEATTVQTKTVEPVAPPQRVTGPRKLQTVSGFKDRLGVEQKWWWYFQKVAFEVMDKYNFLLVHPASVEYTKSYIRSLGKNHPLISENLLPLVDPRGEHISLRPNMDLSFLRAYYVLHRQEFENGIPISNWYTIGSVYGDKHDPRENLQLYIGVIGNKHPVVDAECSMAAYRYIEALGFKNIQILVNSVGGNDSQLLYKQELTTYYKERRKELCDDCKKHVVKDPYQIVVCQKTECKEVNSQAPQSVDWLTEDDKDRFIRVLEYLDELDVPYILSPQLVPVDDFSLQTQLAIQVTTDDETSYVLARGGRFDNYAADLIEMELPAMKMVIDLDKCLTATRNQKMQIPQERLPQVFFAQLGDDAKKKALSLREELHAAGLHTVEHFGQDSLKSQLEQATSLGVKYTCILGQKEILDGTILVRDMDGGIQEEIALDKLIIELKKRLSK